MKFIVFLMMTAFLALGICYHCFPQVEKKIGNGTQLFTGILLKLECSAFMTDYILVNNNGIVGCTIVDRDGIIRDDYIGKLCVVTANRNNISEIQGMTKIIRMDGCISTE